MPVICCAATPLDVTSDAALPRFACGESDFGRVLVSLREHAAVAEAFGLAADGVREFYLLTSEPQSARDALCEAWREVGGAEAASWSEGAMLQDEDAVMHLLRLASGVERAAGGDAAILEKIDAALDEALIAGACGGVLAILARRAVRVGTRLRLSGEQGRRTAALGDLMVRIVEKIHSAPGELRVLLLGTGAMAKETARRFAREPIRSLALAGIDPIRAEAVGRELGADPIDMSEVPEKLRTVDLMIAAMDRVETHFDRATMRKAVAGPRSPLVVLDLCAPGYVDPKVASLDNVFLYDRKGLEAFLPRATQSDTGEAERFIEDAARGTLRLMEWPAVTQLVADLRVRANAIREQHIQRYGRKLDEQERAHVEQFTDSLVRTILSDVTANLESIDPDTADGQQAFDAMRRLLGLDAQEESAT